MGEKHLLGLKFQEEITFRLPMPFTITFLYTKNVKKKMIK
jgi:hypothetical protein